MISDNLKILSSNEGSLENPTSVVFTFSSLKKITKGSIDLVVEDSTTLLITEISATIGLQISMSLV
jgi:hypothetical protein